MSRLEWLLPLAIGTGAFWWLVGPDVLRWGNLGWLIDFDVAAHYLGWTIFRQSPWAWPPGINPAYGLELSNAIVFSDSLPLFALLFKPFDAWLPQTFQYFGLWALLCFVLQACLGYRLVGLATRSPWACALGAAFFVLAPMLSVRLTGHMSLGGQFLLLGALYLLLAPQPRQRPLAWAVLLMVSALVHAYLFIMVAALWGTDVVSRCLRGELRLQRVLVEVPVLTGLTLAVCWLVGYFVPEEGTMQGGYGFYRANLLALFDPMGWSSLLPSATIGEGEYEGFAYLGLGVFFLYLCALPALFRAPQYMLTGLSRHLLLVTALLLMALYAFSNRLALGLHEWVVPLPATVLDLASVFRASGRMLWPLHYALIWVALVLVLRAYPQRIALVLIALALVLQVFEAGPGRERVRETWWQPRAAAFETPMHDPFWAAAAPHYTRVRWIPTANVGPHWRSLADYAARHGMATDAVYLARIDGNQLQRLRAEGLQRVLDGDYEPHTLYVLDDAQFRLALLHAQGDRDLFARIDGLNVVAPGWHACASCPAMAGEPVGLARAKPLQPGAQVSFGEAGEGAAAYLGRGWSHAEAWGTWSDGAQAELLLPLAGSGLQEIELQLQPYLPPGVPQQRVQIRLDGEPVDELTLKGSDRVRVAVPPGLAAPDRVPELSRLTLDLPDAVSPAAVEDGADPRQLGVGLLSLQAR